MKAILNSKYIPGISLLVYFSALLGLFLLSGQLYAGDPATTGDYSIGKASEEIRSSLGDVASLITAAAYVGGIGFAMMGMLKLKAHKDNPTQVPLSQPITLLVIAAGLVFMPSLIKTAGQTIWGDNKGAAGTTGGAKGGHDADGGYF